MIKTEKTYVFICDYRDCTAQPTKIVLGAMNGRTREPFRHVLDLVRELELDGWRINVRAKSVGGFDLKGAVVTCPLHRT